MLSCKLLDNGTDISGFIKAAQEAGSRNEFLRDMSAALRKTSKTELWLQLLFDGGYLDQTQFNSIDADHQDLFHLLIAIVKTTRGQR